MKTSKCKMSENTSSNGAQSQGLFPSYSSIANKREFTFIYNSDNCPNLEKKLSMVAIG